jgi:phosphoglycolate phosphatase-like HAD superfamily hydrolase
MRFYRIGDKVVGRDKIVDEVGAILVDRERGATQHDAAAAHGVDRSFISWLENLGEVRRGKRVALVAFPVENVAEVKQACDDHGVELALVLSQAEREGLEAGRADQMFNMVLDTLADLKDFDVVIILASTKRTGAIEKILGREVIARTLGPSPLRHDVHIDLEELTDLLDAVTAPAPARERAHR